MVKQTILLPILVSLMSLLLMSFCTKSNTRPVDFFTKHHQKPVDIKCVYLQDTVFLNHDTLASGYRFKVARWDLYDTNNYMEKYIFNGILYKEGEAIMYIDSISGLTSRLFNFGKHEDKDYPMVLAHAKGTAYKTTHFQNDTFEVKQTAHFFSSFYKGYVTEFTLERFDQSESLDLSLLVNADYGILGMYVASVLTTDDSIKTKVVFTYIGDMFPYRFDCKDVLFNNRAVEK
ncbi:MAG: hypothetical protein IT270_20770 [Saprospiraceae bacterium]|nr:hypothetical protein [Saprospiraceae bacterium]